MNDLAFRSAFDLVAQIRARAIGCEELLRYFLDRVDLHNPAINAIIYLDAERALERARAADVAIARGEVWGSLHGLPVTVKEAFDVAGMPTTWGLDELKDNIAEHDAAVVRRLLDAGAIIFGKTNVPTMLADWQTYNSLYGTTNNPWDLTRTPGGSSGGAAAALAAGLTGLEIGSDIGGSIRGPAHYCGVYGHKPSYGAVSLEGHALPGRLGSPDISVSGPMARSAADLVLAMEILAGPGSSAALAWRLDLPPAERPVDAYRIGVLADHETAEVDAAVRNAILDLGHRLHDRGLRVDFDARPQFDFQEVHDCFILLLRAATSIGLDGAAIGAAAETARRALQERDYPALMARGNSLRHSDWLKLDEVRQKFRQAWRDFFARFDLLLAPAATTVAFTHNQQGERWERMLTVNGGPQPTTTQMFWAGFSGIAYLPSTVAPIALSPEGLPIGVQIVGPEFRDLRCLRICPLP